MHQHAHAQWNKAVRDSLLPLLDPQERSLDQVTRYGLVSGTWMVSSKARPYLAHLDTLTRLFLTHEREEVRRFARTVRAQYHYNSGYQAKFKRDIPGALGHFEKSCSLSKDLGNLVHLVGSYEALGSLYRSVGEPQLALAYYQEALPLVDPVGDPPRETTLRIAMASAYCDIRRYDLAEDQLALCDTSMPEVHPNVLEGMAYLLEAKGQRAHALKKLDRAAQVMALDPEPWGYIGVYSPMARMKMAGGDHAGALEAASACREVAAGTGDEAGWCTCSILAGEAELALGNSTRAETLLRSALDTARFHGYLGLARETGDEGSMVQAAALLRDIYMRQNRLKEAVEMTTYWSELKDTLNLMDGRLEVLRTNMRRKALTDSLELVRIGKEAQCESDGQLQREQDRRRALLGWGSAALVLLSLIAYFLVTRLKQARRMAALEKNQLRQEAVIAELRMREELRRDVHDDLGSGLSALKLRSELALRDETEGPKRERLRALSAKADELMSSMRELLWSMDTERRSLRDTVDHCTLYTRSYLTEHDIKLELTVTGDWPDLPLDPRQRRNLFLVVKEALHNVMKHANASTVTMTWQWSNGMDLVIQDDGIGLASTTDHAGNGLSNMRERIQELGGTLDADNGPGLRLHVRITEDALKQR